jgi:hypothetical protein
MMTAVVARLSSTVPSRNTSSRGGRKIYYMNKEYKLFFVKKKKGKKREEKNQIKYLPFQTSERDIRHRMCVPIDR